MEFSKFCKKNKQKMVAVILALVVSVAASVGIAENVQAISALRKEQAELPKIETVVVEKPVVIEPETVYFDVPLSHEVQDTIFAECEKYGISPAIVVAQIERESRFNTYAIGDDGRSFGLMQIKVKCHLQRMIDLDCTAIFDPCKNVAVGIDYLAEQLKRYGDIEKALVGYNAGSYKGVVTNYAKSVISRAEDLECVFYES